MCFKMRCDRRHVYLSRSDHAQHWWQYRYIMLAWVGVGNCRSWLSTKGGLIPPKCTIFDALRPVARLVRAWLIEGNRTLSALLTHFTPLFLYRNIMFPSSLLKQLGRKRVNYIFVPFRSNVSPQFDVLCRHEFSTDVAKTIAHKIINNTLPTVSYPGVNCTRL